MATCREGGPVGRSENARAHSSALQSLWHTPDYSGIGSCTKARPWATDPFRFIVKVLRGVSHFHEGVIPNDIWVAVASYRLLLDRGVSRD